MTRDSNEDELSIAVQAAATTYLQRVLAEVREALRTRQYYDTQPVLALGVLLDWWTEAVSEQVVDIIRGQWDAQGPSSARDNAQAFHIAAVRDRLSRSILPELPQDAFDQIRLSLSNAALAGWSTDETARDMAERLAWEPDKTHWKQVKADAEAAIDAILDPFGPPGTPARTVMHQNDPTVKAWQAVRADAVTRINADESIWRKRATRIARTECLPGSASVEGARVRAAYRRFYDGEWVTVRLRSGEEMAGTPNHPVLTDRGWVAFAELTEHDYVLGHRSQIDEGMPPGDENVEGRPPTIGEVFDALALTGIIERKAGGRPDFHGDGQNSDVEIAYADSVLLVGDFAAINERAVEGVLEGTDLAAAAHAAFSSPFRRDLAIDEAVGLRDSTNPDTGLLEDALDNALVGTELTLKALQRPTQLVLLPDVIRGQIGSQFRVLDPLGAETSRVRAGALNAGFSDDEGDLPPGETGLVGKGRAALPGEVFADQVLTVQVGHFSGHVYNLTTLDGYFLSGSHYTANSTAAWNAGSLAALADEGVAGKEWKAHLDDRTRPSHREADGQIVPLGEPFRVGQALLMMPGDPSGPPNETVNCRCVALGADLPNDTLAITAAAGAPDRPSAAIMAVPQFDAAVNSLVEPDQEPHATVVYLGPIDAFTPEDRETITKIVQEAAQAFPPFVADITGVEQLGNDDPQATVWMLDKATLQSIFDHLVATEVGKYYQDADITRYPEYRPHVTAGYGVDPATLPLVPAVPFNKLSLWWGDDRADYPLHGSLPVDNGDMPLLAAARRFLTAAGSEHWRDQLRIPKGNQRRSGRWTFTPWKHLDDLVSMIQALGGNNVPEVSIAVSEARNRLRGVDANNFDVNDPELSRAATEIADLLDAVPATGDPSMDDALRKAAMGTREFGDTDWSLFQEDTDIDGASLGHVTKNVWEGDLPEDEAVDPAMEGRTSRELADELAKIKGHHTAPSPAMRRKRAAAIKELNDRRDRDEKRAAQETELLDDMDIDHLEDLKRVGVTPATQAEADKAEEYISRISALPTREGAFPIDFGLAAENAHTNALDQAVDEGLAKRVNTDDYRTVYEPLGPVTDKDLERWLSKATAQNLTGILDGYGYDQDGKLYSFNESHANTIRDAKTLPELSAALGAVQAELDATTTYEKDSALYYVEQLQKALDNQDRDTFVALAKNLLDVTPGTPWFDVAQAALDQADLLKPAISPKHQAALYRLGQATDYAEATEALVGLTTDFDPYSPEADLLFAVAGLTSRVRNPGEWRTQMDSVLRRADKLPDPLWKGALTAVDGMISELHARDAAVAENTIAERWGRTTETEPSQVVQAIGVYYGVRDQQNNNCVLATLAYELRRRGLDVHPKTAIEGRYAQQSMTAWFEGVYPDGGLLPVYGLERRRPAAKYALIVKHLQDNNQPGSRGAIRSSWRGQRTGHIWNWEHKEDGTVVFWDAQTGLEVPADSSYWQDAENDSIRVMRLDNKTLKYDAMVALAGPSVNEDAEKYREQGVILAQLTVARDQAASDSNAAWKKTMKLPNGPAKEKAMEDYKDANERRAAAVEQIVAFLESPEGEAMKKAGTGVPGLDKNVSRLPANYKLPPATPRAAISKMMKNSSTSPQAKQYQAEIARLSPPLLDFMARKGTTVNIFDGGSVAVHPDMAPVKDQTPRGWPPGSTWKQVAGVSWRGNVYIAADSPSGHGSGSLALHEFGHAVDDKVGRASSSSDFKRAYNALIEVHDRDIAPYFLQKGEAGLSEMWAEAFVHWATDGETGLPSMKKVLASPEGQALLETMTQLIEKEVSK